MKSFIFSQFSFCPSIWMTHSRGLNNKIVYKDFSTYFEGLLAKDKTVRSHNQNLQQLVIKIFKVKMGISPTIMKEIFNFSDNKNYKSRSGTHLSIPIVHTTHYGTESISNLGAKIWGLVQKNIKEANLRNGYQKIVCVVFVRHI